MRLPKQRRLFWTVDAVAGGGEPGPDEPADADLVSRYLRDPDGLDGQRAVSRLFERYRRRVLLWCWQVMKDRELALDLAQEVLTKAFTGLADYRERHRFGAWLFTIARNRCLSELRRRRVPLAGEAVLEMVADENPGPDKALLQKLDEEEFMNLVHDTLEPRELDALRLRCFEGLAVDSITRLLKIQDASGARAVLQRARRKLRSAMKSRLENAEGPRGGGGREDQAK
jgi:RNA polymerase sigma-70 factor (ECF subfamily)